MVCNPNDNQLNPIVSPPVNIPGLGNLFSPLQIPLPGFDLPTELLEDFLALLQQLKAIFPSGTFFTFPNWSLKDVWDFINNILSQIAPFLSFYNFIMAALRLIVCIIEVLCAIPNPFAVANKLIVLFRDCLPPFLNLFPWFALIIMIISLLLLLLALIIYIINTIIAIIEAILRNLQIFADAVTLQDAQATLAAANKIASLLCFIQNLLAIFVALAAILAIIESLAKLAGFGICDDNDEEGCCPEPLCPSWIKTTPDGITSTQAKLIYIKEVGLDVESGLGLPPELAEILGSLLPPTRKERWQVYDNSGEALYPIKIINSPTIENLLGFWSDEVVMSEKTSPKRAQYTADIKITLNPAIFGLTDTQGSRQFVIKDCIVVERPYVGVYTYNNLLLPTNLDGTLSIAGGKVYESDGETPYMIGEEQATLNTFLHLPSIKGTTLPTSDDTLTFDVELTWFPNVPGLASLNLTTVGCIPEVSVEKAALNALITAEGIEPINLRLPPTPDGQFVRSTGFLPNVAGAQQCVETALAKLRTNVSAEGLAEFQATAISCLTDLQNQTTAAICGALLAGVSQFKSDYQLDTDLQFTTRPIEVAVSLRDAGGTILTTNIPETCADQLADKLSAEVTLGSISKFTYDGASLFKANLVSDVAGSGEITVLFDNKVLSIYQTGTPSSIVENVKSYTFVDSGIAPPERRDETDVGA